MNVPHSPLRGGSMDPYTVVRRLGTGTYGSAYLICLKSDTSTQFVLKKIRLDQVCTRDPLSTNLWNKPGCSLSLGCQKACFLRSIYSWTFPGIREGEGGCRAGSPAAKVPGPCVRAPVPRCIHIQKPCMHHHRVRSFILAWTAGLVLLGCWLSLCLFGAGLIWAGIFQEGERVERTCVSRHKCACVLGRW